MKHIKKILLFLMLFSIKSATAQIEFLEIEILDYVEDDGTFIGEMNIKF